MVRKATVNGILNITHPSSSVIEYLTRGFFSVNTVEGEGEGEGFFFFSICESPTR